MSARVFSRLLGVARKVRMSFSGKLHLGLMSLPYTDDEALQWLVMGLDVRPPVFAPGFLRTERAEWTSRASRFLGDISVGDSSPSGGFSVVAMFEPGDMAKKLLGLFKTFCKLAGSHLPDDILQGHAFWPNDPVSRWLTFLWRVGALEDSGLTVLTIDAFDTSARAIERCRLNTDSPLVVAAVLENLGPDPSAPAHVECLVTLLQAASMVNKAKNTLEKRARKYPMPLPVVEGGGGKAAEWEWSTIRPWLEEHFGRKLPEQFPSSRFICR